MAGPIAEHIVSISSTGAITSEATIADALSHNVELRDEIAQETAEVEKGEEVVADKVAVEDTAADVGKLVADEDVELGHVSLAAGV